MKQLSALFIVVMLVVCMFDDIKLAWTVAGICAGLYGLVLVGYLAKRGRAR